MTMKVFLIGNYDGRTSRLVAAETKKLAAELMGCSVNDDSLTTLGVSHTLYPVAMSHPGVVWTRPAHSIMVDPWTPVGPVSAKPPVRVTWHISTGRTAGTERGEWEIDWYEYHGRVPAAREKLLDEYMQDELDNHIDSGYSVVEG